MAPRTELEVKRFKGLRNDENSKNIPADFLYKIKNYNFPETGILGLDKILMPSRITQFDSANIDGMCEYRYLDDDNVLQTEYIVVCNGDIWKTDLVTPTSTSSLLKTGLTAGKVSFSIYNDKLYITNGIDNIQVYDGTLAKRAMDVLLNDIGVAQSTIDSYLADGTLSLTYDMGSCFAYQLSTASTGALDPAVHYYAVTFVTAGGEEIIGAISNSMWSMNAAGTNDPNYKIMLMLPIGYTGTTSRNIYEFLETGPATIEGYLLDTVANNTDLTYTVDKTLIATPIPTTNNAHPKPYFLAVANQKMYGTVSDSYPTQLFVTGTSIEVFDAGDYLDISNYGIDNTPTVGMGIDFNKIIVGTQKNIWIINPADDSVVLARANVGMKSGYTVKTIPSFGEFPGGLMFVSSLNDVRIMSGLQALPVATSLDNVTTENWAQAIRGELETQLATYTNIYAEFYKNKYHLVINGYKYVFDIRTQGWTQHNIKTTNYTSTPIVLAVLNNLLYNGQADGWVELEYQSTQYRSEDVEAYFETPHIAVNSKFKYIEKIEMWFIPSASNELQVNVVTDDNSKFNTNLTFSILSKSHFSVVGGVYNDDFSENYFDVDLAGMDYRVININTNCRWLKFTVTNTIGNISFQGFKIIGQELANKESLITMEEQ